MRTHRSYDLSKLSVMVVDDNHAMLKIMRTVLLSMGVREVHLYGNALDAFDDLSITRPDVIFTDWVMEPVSGREFIKMIRSIAGSIKFAPVVVLTGHADRKLVGMARDAGADYTLSKPVSLDNVFKAFMHMMSGDRPFVQVGQYFGPDRRRKARPFEFADRRGGGPRDEAPTARPEPDGDAWVVD